MKLKTRERYTLRLMMAIATLSRGDSPVGLGQVSSHSGISRRYLEQLVKPLKHAHLVHSIAGREGGYMLSRGPEAIRIADIFSAATGELAVTDCAVCAEACEKSNTCNCQGLFALINHRIKETLNAHSLADLIAADWPRVVEKQMISQAQIEKR